MSRASRFFAFLAVLLLSGQASAAPPILPGQLKAGAVQQFSPVGNTYNARILAPTTTRLRLVEAHPSRDFRPTARRQSKSRSTVLPNIA